EPSHCQVSPNNVPLPPEPPNNSARPRCESNAIAWSERGVGAVAGVWWNHCVPSHSHVSASITPFDPDPPNRTLRARIGSYTDAASSRGGGSGTGPGVRCVQLLPSHSHVSPKLPKPRPPPNKTVQARVRSYAIPLFSRDGGLAAGWRCAQFVP